ncbi:MAG: hypothetical protein KBS36_01380, partial [Bacteroidales bacterium]|nr:hypothetical protein [Candidatus Cryptobacteroides fimicaballi]
NCIPNVHKKTFVIVIRLISLTFLPRYLFQYFKELFSLDLFAFLFAQLPRSTGHNRQVAHALTRRFTRLNQKYLKECLAP